MTEKPLDELNNDEKQKMLPVPTTYHILCMVPKADDTYRGGIVKAEKSKEYEELLSPVLYVLAVGPDAYADKTRFPNGPSCKVDDFIVVRPSTGTRLKIRGQEFRIINDDSVEAVVDDPRGILY